MCLATETSLLQIIDFAVEVCSGMEQSLLDSENDSKEIAFNLLQKGTLAALSFQQIRKGGERIRKVLGTDSQEAYDFTSAGILVRTVFEGYLTADCLFRCVRPKEEQQLLLIRWRLHSRSELLRMLTAIGSNRPGIEKIRLEKEELLDRVMQDPSVIGLADKVKNKIRKGSDWKPLNPRRTDLQRISDLAEAADVHESQRSTIYKLVSSYAHCEGIGLLHIGRARQGVPEYFVRCQRVWMQTYLALTLDAVIDQLDWAKGWLDWRPDIANMIEWARKTKWHDTRTGLAFNRNENDA